MENAQPAKNKKVHIETWGCQMNVADSEKMLSMLEKEDYKLSQKAEDSDLIILNTCHIREKARHKVVSRLGVLKELKKENPKLQIAVTGCVAQAEGKKLLSQASAIDVLIGPGKLNSLPSLLEKQSKSGEQELAIGFEKPNYQNDAMSCQSSAEPQPSVHGKNEVSRFVNIQQGCDNFCTFCVVPHTRGREISDSPNLIFAKSKALVKTGVKEVTLLGQNVNSYGLDLIKNDILPQTTRGPFVDLLDRVAQIEGLKRLRFTTSNPHDLTKPLADIFRTQSKLGKYFHLPVQSGSDSILASMRRKVTQEEYLKKVSWLRSAVPDMAISTDLIVGFPGETDEDFEKTIELVKKVQFSFVFAFKYSKRKGTAAIRFKDQIPENIKSERLARLNAVQNEITINQNSAEVGQKREVLFLYESKKEKNIYYGRTEHFRLVRVKCETRNLAGELSRVMIIASNKTALEGKLI